jgi:hypothetical protein
MRRGEHRRRSERRTSTARLLVPGLVLALLAVALASVALADRARKQAQMDKAWVVAWGCAHQERGCTDTHPREIERRWQEREEWYAAGASGLLLAAPVGLLVFGTRRPRIAGRRAAVSGRRPAPIAQG